MFFHDFVDLGLAFGCRLHRHKLSFSDVCSLTLDSELLKEKEEKASVDLRLAPSGISVAISFPRIRHARSISKVCAGSGGCGRLSGGLSGRGYRDLHMVCGGPLLPLFGYVAISDQHRHVHRDVPDRIPYIIQNTQNREAKVMQLKLDELIRAVRAARTELVRMEALTDEELIMDPCFKTTQ